MTRQRPRRAVPRALAARSTGTAAAPRSARPGGRVYSARFRGSGGAVKHVTLVRRSGGRFARRGTFRTIAGCGDIRDATLARPGVRRPRAGKPLDIRFRLNTARARRGHGPPRQARIVRRFARPQPRRRPHDPPASLAARRARGTYRVTIRARPVGAPPQTVRLAAIRI